MNLAPNRQNLILNLAPNGQKLILPTDKINFRNCDIFSSTRHAIFLLVFLLLVDLFLHSKDSGQKVFTGGQMTEGTLPGFQQFTLCEVLGSSNTTQ